jgi:hypothetical protein
MGEASRYTLPFWATVFIPQVSQDLPVTGEYCVHGSSSEGGVALFLRCREPLFANRPFQPAHRTAIQSHFFPALHNIEHEPDALPNTRLNYDRYFMTNANAPFVRPNPV